MRSLATRRLTQLVLQVTPCENDEGAGFRSKAPARPREPSSGVTTVNDGYDAKKAYTNVTEYQKPSGKSNVPCLWFSNVWDFKFCF